MVVARTAGLLAVAGAAALAWRFAGRPAATVAALLVVVSPWWAYNTILGNSEGMLAAALLWAAVAHLDGRRMSTLALLTAAALLRPEVWPFLGAYGIWLWRAEPALRPWVGAAGAAVPLLWIGPDLLGVGGAVRASRAARGEPSPGSAGLADVPGLAVLADAVSMITWPAALAVLAGVVLGSRVVRLLAAAAGGWIVLVAVMAQAGYAGNPRYLVAAVAVGCVVAGVGVARLGAAIAARRADRDSGLPRAVVPGLAVAVVVGASLVALSDLRFRRYEVALRAERQGQLDGVLAAAGGSEALLRCSRIRTEADVRPLVAWRLDLPMLDLDEPPRRPAVVIRYRSHYTGAWQPLSDPPAEGYRRLAATSGWQIWAACGRAPQSRG
jgi:hypothetical protein